VARVRPACERALTREREYDVAIVGAGDVGCAIARELSRFKLQIALIEAGRDVGAGTSKANTALLHTGFDSKPGSLEARLVARGHGLLLDYADQVGIPLERTGALLVAWDDGQMSRFPGIVENAHRCGHHGLRALDAAELRELEPNLGPEALGAIEVPDEYIVCPFTPPLAFASQAVLAGTTLLRSERVTGLTPIDSGGWRVDTTRGRAMARWVINAAGLFSDELHRMAGYDGFTVTPRRGELIVFDKLSRPLVRHVVLPVPTETTKGVLIAPTVFGNVMLGPTAVDIERKEDTSSTAEGIAYLKSKGRQIIPKLLEHEVTAVYVGLRAATEHSDFQVEVDGDRGYACAAGIRSTGLTASMAIAEYLRDELGRVGLPLAERPEGLPAVRMPYIGEARDRPYASPSAIARDPDYGRIVCFCERVTRGEIRDAATAAVPAFDLDGLRRRTRAGMGRCQGFYCAGAVAAALAQDTGRSISELMELAP
jgi:glycerol-3-phosphate dehydrogenase